MDKIEKRGKRKVKMSIATDIRTIKKRVEEVGLDWNVFSEKMTHKDNNWAFYTGKTKIVFKYDYYRELHSLKKVFGSDLKVSFAEFVGNENVNALFADNEGISKEISMEILLKKILTEIFEAKKSDIKKANNFTEQRKILRQAIDESVRDKKTNDVYCRAIESITGNAETIAVKSLKSRITEIKTKIEKEEIVGDAVDVLNLKVDILVHLNPQILKKSPKILLVLEQLHEERRKREKKVAEEEVEKLGKEKIIREEMCNIVDAFKEFPVSFKNKIISSCQDIDRYYHSSPQKIWNKNVYEYLESEEKIPSYKVRNFLKSSRLVYFSVNLGGITIQNFLVLFFIKIYYTWPCTLKAFFQDFYKKRIFIFIIFLF